MEKADEELLLDKIASIIDSNDKSKAPKKRCWREIESIREEFRLKRELEEIEHGYEHDYG